VVKNLLPNAEIVSGGTARAFFRGEIENVDLMGVEAEGGAAWTLIYPKYSIIVPTGVHVKGSSAVALPKDQGDFLNFVDAWIDVSKKSGLIEQLERYWIQGLDDTRKPARWSIMGNALGWGQTEAKSASATD